MMKPARKAPLLVHHLNDCVIKHALTLAELCRLAGGLAACTPEQLAEHAVKLLSWIEPRALVSTYASYTAQHGCCAARADQVELSGRGRPAARRTDSLKIDERDAGKESTRADCGTLDMHIWRSPVSQSDGQSVTQSAGQSKDLQCTCCRCRVGPAEPTLPGCGGCQPACFRLSSLTRPLASAMRC